jgi:Rieske Fe-S protein
MGAVGSLVGAVLTIPPAVFVLSPTIQTNIQGRSDVPDEWYELGSVFEIPANEPKTYRIEFPQRQTYNGGGALMGEGTIMNAILVSWREGELPSILEDRGEGSLSESEIEELSQDLYVMSNHCAHLGCPVRWFPDLEELLCPCHGGIYDINGGLLGGPPPQGLYYYAFEIREDGRIYVRHEFTNGEPYVV